MHKIQRESDNNQQHQFCLMSDLHWDNPKCRRDLLAKDLEHCKNHGIPILMNGDLFCAMEGRHDRRRSRNIMPDHNSLSYYDNLVNDAVQYFQPYAHLIELVGYGNHETSVLRNGETDLLKRFCAGIGRPQALGGYGGWFRISLKYNKGRDQQHFNLKYYHGSGGGGIITKGTIAQQRMLSMIDGADAIWMGHVHEGLVMHNVKERIRTSGKVELAPVLQIRTPTYKEEYGEGKMGWHVERGAPPKPLGCYILELTYNQKRPIIADAFALRC